MIYLVDKPLATVAFRTARDSPDARIVLLQDGVLLKPGRDVPDLDVPIQAIGKDVDVRGVDLPPNVERIDYDTVLEDILEMGVRSFT